MAEALKASFGEEKISYVADLLGTVYPIDRAAFDQLGRLEGFETAELIARSQLIADAMAETLPHDRSKALQVIIDALEAEPWPTPEPLVGMEGFRYMPLVQFVAAEGLDHFELAMHAQHELTQRFTAEFSIRSFIENHPEPTLERLRLWTSDPSEHVRRLVSEGTRPRLPWAPRLRAFMRDPAPVVDLLEPLRDDPSEYVRRSVANNINDIAKDHPDVAIDIARRWWADTGRPDDDVRRRRLVRHGLRTLIKAGDREALDVLGYTAGSSLKIEAAAIDPEIATIGDSVRCSVELHNADDQHQAALVDFRVWFVKANGKTSPKVFKGTEADIAPGESITVSKRVSLKQHSTRTHHPGDHLVEVLVNGDARPVGRFDLRGIATPSE